jgi:hypothetical protein
LSRFRNVFTLFHGLMPTFSGRRVAFGCFLALGALFVCDTLQAQSIIRGEVEGTVRSPDEQPLRDASIMVTDARTGASVWIDSERDGSFRIPLLHQGEYEILVEAMGYVPRLFRGVRVDAGRRIRLDLELEPAPPPVDVVDTVFVGVSVADRFDADAGRRISRAEIASLQDRRMGLAGLGALSPVLDGSLGSEGLPGALSAVVLDGIRFTPASHPLQSGGAADLPLFPLLGLQGLDVHRGTDVEWAGAAGSYVSASSRPAARERGLELFGSGTTNALWQSEPFSGVTEPDMHSAWGGGAAHMPLGDDAAHLIVTVDGMYARTPRLSPFSDDLAQRLVQARPPADGAGAADLSDPWLNDLRSVSGSSRLDWDAGGSTEVTARATFATRRDGGGRFFASPLEYGLAAPADGTDISAAVSVLTAIDPRVSLEIRAGYESSVRDWGGTEGGGEPSFLPATRFTETGALLGPDPGLAGRVSRAAFLGESVAHVRWRGHSFKGGLAVSVPSYRYEHAYRSGGEFVFASPERLAVGQGLFQGYVGSVSDPTFIIPEAGAFLQHRWEPVRGIEMTSGVRFDHEWLPDRRVRANERWEELTGLRRHDFNSSLLKFSPRIGVAWDVTGDERTLVRGSLATHHHHFDPATFNEMFVHAGSRRQVRRIGALGAWPALPTGSAGDQHTGRLLALFGPEVEAPRTARGTLGLSQRLGGGTSVHLSGTFRRTQFLLRRSDLNLPAQPFDFLADGRPVYGNLVQVGSLVAAEPGTNRRFPEFDQVWALSADGWSDYQAVTFSFEHEATDRLDLFGSYTFSSTEDNLVGMRTGIPEARTGPRLGEDSGSDWERGVSDFDAPHRVVAGFLARLPALEGIEISSVYRYRSGLPFTPGFRAGVDVNADGSGHNDPAFVEEGGEGRLACLNRDVGEIARRNGCRASGAQFLDLHLSFGLFRVGSSVAAFTLDLFNLLDTELGSPDTALLLVDGDGALEREAGTDRIRIPLQRNPRFGEVANPVRPGRLLRIGFRVGLP